MAIKLAVENPTETNEDRPERQSRAGLDETPEQEDRAPPPNGQGSEGSNGVLDVSEFDAGAVEDAIPATDDFDRMEDFALAQDFNPNEVEEEPPVARKRPPRDDYFRVHPDPKMTITVGIYEPGGRAGT